MNITTYPNGSFMVNTYLVVNTETNESIIIDPGSDIKKVLDDVASRHIMLQAIVCTHGHIDHIEGIEHVRKKYSCPVYLNELDYKTAHKTKEFAVMFGVPVPDIPEIDNSLPTEGSITLAGLNLQLFHTPGHSPGSISILIEEHLFSGDVLFNGSIGRTDLPGGNYEQLIESIQSKLYILSGDTIVYPGHGPKTTISHEKTSNPFVRTKL